MGIFNPLRRLFEGASAPALGTDEVRVWYESLTGPERATWSERIRGAQKRSGAERTGVLRTATGRLVFFHDGRCGVVPMHHIRVELWDHDPGGMDDFLGVAVTDADGHFSIAYDPRDAGPGDLPDLELRVMEASHTWDRDGGAHDTFSRIFTLRGPDDVDVPVYDFGEVRVPCWEYAPGSVIPRLHITEQGSAPESYAPGRSLAMMRAVDAVEVAKRAHITRINMGLPPSIDDIQADYPLSITTRREAEQKGATRDAAWFGDRYLNGFFSQVLDHDWDQPDDPDAYRVFTPWNAYEQDGVHCLPSVDIRLRVRDGKLEPTRVTLGMRERGATAPMSPITRIDVTPADGPRWRAALRFARVSATFDAELSNHLGQCHLNVEQYAIAARRNLRASPLRWLLFPHLREVALINQSANDFLLGPRGYVTRAGALTPAGIDARIAHVMGGYDWKGFRPQPPVCEAHRAARASAMFWEILGEHVDAFLSEHRDDIAATWIEVQRMSDDLVSHAAPFFACSFVQRKVIGQRAPFVQRSERINYDAPRVEVDGVARAVSPVTTSVAPSEQDWANLAQMCRYVLFFATFRHAWANNQQWDDCGELRYVSLGLRWADGDPLSHGEDDDDIAPEPLEATEMLWISWLLSRANYGTIVTNEEGDVHPRLVKLVRARRKELEALGLQVDRMASRVNI